MYNNCSSSAAASDLSCVGLYGESNAFCSGGLVDVWLEMSVSGVFIIVCASASATFTSRFFAVTSTPPPKYNSGTTLKNRCVVA